MPRGGSEVVGRQPKSGRARILLQADERRGVGTGKSRRTRALGTVENVRRRFAGRLRGGAGAQAPGDAAGGDDGEQEAVDRAAPGRAAAGLREAAAVGAARGGVGDRRVVESRDRSADAKKNVVSGRKVAYWVIPPEADAEFAANMELVRRLREALRRRLARVLCMDEQPVQLVRETRRPSRPPRSARGASITSTSAPARRRSSCSAWLDFGGRARRALRSPIGRARWRIGPPRRLRACHAGVRTTFNTQLPEAPSTKCSSRPGRAPWCAATATRRSTAAG